MASSTANHCCYSAWVASLPLNPWFSSRVGTSREPSRDDAMPRPIAITLMSFAFFRCRDGDYVHQSGSALEDPLNPQKNGCRTFPSADLAQYSIPDMAAEPERLAKGEPALSGEAVLDDRTPQDQHIDPGISALRSSVARHGERRLDCRRSPWLHPGDTPGLQLGDDLVGDFGVKARAVVAGTTRVVCLDIAVLRDGRRKPLFRPSTRRGRPGPHSHSQHGDAARTSGETDCHPRRCLCARGGSPKGEDPRSGAPAQPTARSRREAAPSPTQIWSARRSSVSTRSKRWNQRRTHPHVALFLGRLTAKRELDCGGALCFV